MRGWTKGAVTQQLNYHQVFCIQLIDDLYLFKSQDFMKSEIVIFFVYAIVLRLYHKHDKINMHLICFTFSTIKQSISASIWWLWCKLKATGGLICFKYIIFNMSCILKTSVQCYFGITRYYYRCYGNTSQ